MNTKNDSTPVESTEVNAEVAPTTEAPKLVVKTGVRAGAKRLVDKIRIIKP